MTKYVKPDVRLISADRNHQGDHIGTG